MVFKAVNTLKKNFILIIVITLFAASARAENSNRYCHEIADMCELIMRNHQYGKSDEAGTKASIKFAVPLSYLGSYPNSINILLTLTEDIYSITVFPLKEQKDAAIKAISRNIYLVCKTKW